MNPRYELAAPAERDLEDIFFEVHERHGRLVAERVFDSLLWTFDLLARTPEMGRHRPELWPPPYRFWVTGPAFIVYRADVPHHSHLARVARLEPVPASWLQRIRRTRGGSGSDNV